MADKKEHTIVVRPTGEILFVYSDGLREILDFGQAEIFRASHVEPTGDNRWTADMTPVKGPILGPFDTREQALREEVKWIKENYLVKAATA